jgi:hypothetical protein
MGLPHDLAAHPLLSFERLPSLGRCTTGPDEDEATTGVPTGTGSQVAGRDRR